MCSVQVRQDILPHPGRESAASVLSLSLSQNAGLDRLAGRAVGTQQCSFSPASGKQLTSS